MNWLSHKRLIPSVIIAFLVALSIGFFAAITSGKFSSIPPERRPAALSVSSETSSYLGTTCVSNSHPQFTHDVTDGSKIWKVTPTSLLASNAQDRAFLWIDQGKAKKVPIYAPADADLIRGVYKISKNIETIDYDLHFQVSCEVWFYINHISAPIEKIKDVLPSKPATTTASLTSFHPPMHFKAGELIGYTTGTAQAHNFDFAVFDLNHTNKLIGDATRLDSRFKNFLCPFDVLPAKIQDAYYKKLEAQPKAEANCVKTKS